LDFLALFHPPSPETAGMPVEASFHQMFSRLATSGPSKLNAEAIQRRRKGERSSAATAPACRQAGIPLAQAVGRMNPAK